MLIMCKSCKKLVDTNKHDFCPKCGSNFNYGENLTAATNTADYEEYERRMAEQQRAAVENRMNNTKQATKKETQKRLKKQANDAQGKKNGCIGCFAVVIFLFAAFGSIFADGDIDVDEILEKIFEEEISPEVTTPAISFDAPDYVDIESIDFQTPEVETEDQPSYLVGVGETAYTENYAVTCTEVSLFENEFLPAEEGYQYISFILRLENITDSSRFYFGNVRCISIEECPQASFTGIFFPGELEAGGVYEKSVIFQVPEDEYFYDIYFNDEVIIYTSVADIEGYFEDYEG